MNGVEQLGIFRRPLAQRRDGIVQASGFGRHRIVFDDPEAKTIGSIAGCGMSNVAITL
jgi:hypothetical protein